MKAAAASLDPRARVARKRLRDLRRWARSSPVALLTVLGALTVVAVLSLTFGDHAGVAHMEHVDAAEYWTLGVTDKGQLPSGYPAAGEVERFVAGAVRYVVRASRIAAQSNGTYGRFNYRYTLRMGRLHQSGSYNLLRHAGTADALADACPPSVEESELPPCCAGSRDALLRAANWLASTSAPMGSGAIGLWSNRSLEAPRKRSAIKKPNVVKAGGLGLGLIALLGGRRAGAPVSKSLLRGVARGITHIFQRPDGHIDAFFSARTMAVERERSSDYYPGEAALGLIHLYADTGILAYRTAALRIVLRRARTNDADAADGERPICDHWMLIAIGHLMRDGATHRWSTRTAGGRRQRVRILRHARRVARYCHTRNEHQDATDKVLANRYGSSVEGLLNVVPLLAEAGCADGLCADEARTLYCGARRALGAAMAMQYRADKAEYAPLLDGAVANVGVVELRGTRRVRIGFDGIFQIDTTQHTLSAALAYGRASRHPALADVECSHARPLIDVVGTISDVVQARYN